MTLNIDCLMQVLSCSRPIFHSEADFQHALAWQISKKVGGHKVRLEYPFTTDESDNRELDIWLSGERIALELKYFTMKFCCNHQGEPFVLKQHGNADVARYSFLRDVQRLEHLVHVRRTARTGFAVLLTNAPTLWCRSYTRKRNPNDKNFHLYDDRTAISGKLKWQKDGCPIEEDALCLSGCYTPHWKDYSCFPSQKNGGKFRYLAFEIQTNNPTEE